MLYLKRYRKEVVDALKAEDNADEVFGADILFDALSEPMRQVGSHHREGKQGKEARVAGELCRQQV